MTTLGARSYDSIAAAMMFTGTLTNQRFATNLSYVTNIKGWPKQRRFDDSTCTKGRDYR